MSSDFSHRLIMLKPMQTAASGYARIQSGGGQVQLQINARGLRVAAMRAFWYAGGGEVRELGSVRVNPHGEATITAELPSGYMGPERLQALLIVGGEDEPTPLLIGLCVPQSAGSLLDAKNALLALCDKLSRSMRKRREEEHELVRKHEGESVQGTIVESAGLQSVQAGEEKAIERIAQENKMETENTRIQEGTSFPFPPREVFLPAIDPIPYIKAKETVGIDEIRQPNSPAANVLCVNHNGDKAVETIVKKDISQAEGACESSAVTSAFPTDPPRRDLPACDRLRPLLWPRTFAQLRTYFDHCLPCAPFALPGWRFVRVLNAGQSTVSQSAENGLWIGYAQQDGRVTQVAYAFLAAASPKDGRPYHARQGTDGKIYQVLWQRV